MVDTTAAAVDLILAKRCGLWWLVACDNNSNNNGEGDDPSIPNDDNDGHRRGHHRGRYAAGGVGGGGVVGRVIEGVRRLRPAVSVGKGRVCGGSLVLTDAGTHM